MCEVCDEQLTDSHHLIFSASFLLCSRQAFETTLGTGVPRRSDWSHVRTGGANCERHSADTWPSPSRRPVSTTASSLPATRNATGSSTACSAQTECAATSQGASGSSDQALNFNIYYRILWENAYLHWSSFCVHINLLWSHIIGIYS